MYTAITYLTYKMIEELVLAVPISLAFSAVVYFPVQLQGSWLLFWLVYLCTLANGFGERVNHDAWLKLFACHSRCLHGVLPTGRCVGMACWLKAVQKHSAPRVTARIASKLTSNCK